MNFFKTIKNILRKIKDFFIFYNIFGGVYINHHFRYADKIINYLMDEAEKICISDDYYYILIQTKDKSVYALWNANFPYSWISNVYKLSNDYKLNYENDKQEIEIYDGIPTYKFVKNDVYYNMRPSRKIMLKFKEWIEDRSDKFETR